MSNFLSRLAVDVRPYCKTLQGAAYIPWALALEMAGFPSQETVMFKENGQDRLSRSLFGGAAVAVDHSLPNGQKQRVYLPVLDNRNYPIASDAVDGRDLTDTINRCKARAAAMVEGVGLSLWSAVEGNGPEYVDALRLTPESDLRKAQEIRDVKEVRSRGPNARVIRSTEYLGWHAALSAARITDGNFHWEVMECQAVNDHGELETLPALRAGGKGWIVGVKVTWKGKTHVEWLPIMGVEERQTNNGPKKMEHQSIAEVTVFHWHSAVMRCLAKAVAMLTGYGIRCYAGEFGLREEDEEALQGNQQAPQDTARQQPVQTNRQEPNSDKRVVEQKTSSPDRRNQEMSQEELIVQVRNHLKVVRCEESAFVSWLQVDSLDSASIQKLKIGLASLNSRIKERDRANHKH